MNRFHRKKGGPRKPSGGQKKRGKKGPPRSRKAVGRRQQGGGHRAGGDPSLSQVEQQVYRKAYAIQRKNGIPFDDALEIAAREASIPLRKFKASSENTKIDELESQYKLPRSVVGNVISGNISLEKAILRNDIKKNMTENRIRSCLIDSMESGEEIEIHFLGSKDLRGRVTEIMPYTFLFKKTPKTKRDTKALEYLKLHVKYGYPPAFAAYVEEKRGKDGDLKKQKLKPPRRIVDRRMIKNEKLQRYMKTRAPLLLKTYEGEVFRGKLTWWGQYEIGLDLGNGVQVTFFRHAVYLIAQA